MDHEPLKPSAPFAVVVNDDPTLLNLLSDLVRKAGLEPHAFISAETALMNLFASAGMADGSSEALPALIATDLYMPGIDGWRFCRLLRSPEYAAFNQVPILVISSTFAGEEAARIAADLGAEAFLTAPVEERGFIEQVRGILSGRRVRNPLRVLIVEESEIQSGILKNAFEANGYQTDMALTAREAADAFKKIPFDVAVLDYQLPDGAGDALLDEFRAERPDCVCLMMTTDPGPELVFDWMKRGAAAYLRKPFEPDVLIELCTQARRERVLLRVQDLLELRTRELQKSEERHRAILQTAMDGFWLADLQGRLLEVNETYCRMSGYRKQELLAMRISDLEAAETADDIAARIQKIMAQSNDRFESRHRHKDGSIFDVEVSAQYRTSEDGQCVAFLRDITERKRAAAALIESEERFKQLFDEGPFGVVLVNSDFRFVMVNPAFCAMLGYTEPELKTMTFKDITHPENIAADFENVLKLMSGELRVYSTEKRYLRKNQEEIWGKATITTLHDKNGQFAYLLGMIDDINERKQAEEGLRKSERLYRSLFENMLNGFAYCRMLFEDGKPQDFIYLAVNDAFESLTGLKNVAGRKVSEVIPGIREADPQLLEIYGRVAMTGQSERFEMFVEAMQMWFWISVYCPAHEHFVAVFDVITESKRAEEALRQSEKQFRLLVESSPDAIFVQTEGRFAYLNEAAVCLFGGKDSGDILGKSVLDRFHPDFREKVRKRIRLLNEERSSVPRIEEIYLRLDGTQVPVEVSAVPIHFEGSDGALVFVRDITERKRIEEEKAILGVQLQQAQKMESVGRLAGGVAHDFNNMLGVILGHAEMAMDQVDPAQPLHTDLQEILKAAHRSADLTRQLLAFARKQTVAPKELDLNETVAGMLKMLQRLIGEDIQLNWQPERDLWLVRVDPSQIDQILANLCVNARDAIADVGKITIETGNNAFDEAYCFDHPGLMPGEYVRLAVSDDGCGMDQETLGHIFEPFFTTKGVGEGTGLGLATVYGAVKQNNGFINACSKPGQGSTFTLYFPRHMGKAGQAWKEVSARPLRRGLETILLVEDEPTILKLTQRMLETQGYNVLTSSTPGEAIRLAREHNGEIELLITDVVMPEMNGRDLAKNLLPLYPRLKRLFMSGYTANVVAHHGVLNEGVNFVQKPFSIHNLVAKVREVLDNE